MPSADTTRPVHIYAGDRFAWRETIDADALELGPNWTVSYALLNDATGTRYQVDGALVDGETDVYEFAVSTADSLAWESGHYRYVRIIRDGTERTVDPDRGMVDVLPDPEGDDCPSFDQQMVQALRASLIGRATDSDQAFLEGATVNGESVALLTLPEMQALLREYERRVAGAIAKGRAAAGKKSRRNIVFTF
jgi:hypothetical protein